MCFLRKYSRLSFSNLQKLRKDTAFSLYLLFFLKINSDKWTYFLFSLFFAIAKLQYEMVHEFIMNCLFILVEKASSFASIVEIWPKIPLFLQSININLNIKNKKLFNLKIYLREKLEEKLKLYLFLRQVLGILNIFFEYLGSL